MRYFFYLILLLPSVFCGINKFESSRTLAKVLEKLPWWNADVILSLSNGLNYKDLETLLKEASKPSSDSKQSFVMKKLLDKYEIGLTDATKVQMILAELSSALYNFDQPSQIASMVFRTGISNNRTLTKYADLSRIVEITRKEKNNALAAAQLWLKYATWMKKEGIDINDELIASLKCAICSPEFCNSGFYQSILKLNPDKNNRSIIRDGSLGFFPEGVKRGLENYGYKFETLSPEERFILGTARLRVAGC